MADDIKKILADFMNSASPEEVRELESLLAARQKSSRGSVDAAGFAGQISRQIQSQIGFTRENVKQTAIELVVKMARQHKPDITEAELGALVDQMVPTPRLPSDVLRRMVMNYVMFKTGRMSAEELAGFPEGWQNKFWEAFPSSVKRIVNDFLNKRLEPEEFWQRIKQSLT
jgi:hypothetical protein